MSKQTTIITATVQGIKTKKRGKNLASRSNCEPSVRCSTEISNSNISQRIDGGLNNPLGNKKVNENVLLIQFDKMFMHICELYSAAEKNLGEFPGLIIGLS